MRSSLTVLSTAVAGSMLTAGLVHAQVTTPQPIHEVQPGVWESQLDNPRPAVAVTLGSLEEGLRAFEQGINFSQGLRFEVESYASPLSPGSDPYSETEWFQERSFSYGLYRDATEAANASSYYAPGSTWWFETSGVRLGHGRQSLMWSRNFWDGSVMQRQFLPEQQWSLSDDTILIPVHVIDAYPVGGSPQLTPASAALLFDDVTYFQGQRVTAPGGELEEYLLNLTSDRKASGITGYQLYEVGDFTRPDDIFAQCGIQFRLASYVAVEMQEEVYLGQVSKDWGDVADCITQYVNDDGNLRCAVPYDNLNDGCSSGGFAASDNRATGPEVARFFAAQSQRLNLVTGQMFTGHQPGIDVVLTGSLDSAETANGCPGPLYGLSDASRWTAVASLEAYNEPTTMSHEIGHVLLRSSNHPDPANGAINLMKEGAGDGYHIPGCQGWANSLPTSAWNCNTAVVDQPSSFLCDTMRSTASSLGSAVPSPSPDGGLDMEMPPAEKLGWSYGRAADGPSSPAEFSNAQFTEGSAAIVVPDGYAHIGSPLFRTADITEVGTAVEVDVYIPAVVPNDYWVGTLAVSFEHAPTSTYSVLGQFELTGLTRGGWNTLSFNLPATVRDVLFGDFPVGQFVVTTNTPSGGSESLFVDGFRMAGDLEKRTVSHQEGSDGVSVNTNALTSFENLADWSSTASLSLVSDPVSDLSSALAVEASGWTVVQSRWFDTSELPAMTSQFGIDVYVPDPQPNPWWVGEVQIVVDCPSANVHSGFVGSKPLMPLFHDEYNHIVFDIPQSIQNALATPGQCRISPILNVTAGAGTFLIDRLGFN